jgi:hypothetical protein
MQKRRFFSMGVLVLIVILWATFGYSSEVRYLTNNIHAQRSRKGELKASYANWIKPGAGHQIIPVNTPVAVGRWLRGFSLITQDEGKKIFFEYNGRNMAFSVVEYIDLISSMTQVSLSKMSKIDQQGIKAGKAMKGMSKNGVKIALGYPATHKTPSLEENVWIYWKDRWRMSEVVFDVKGFVISVR